MDIIYKMNNYFKMFCKLFDTAKCYYEEIENSAWKKTEFQFMYKEIGISASPKTKPMAALFKCIYLKDNISLLEILLGTEKTVIAIISLNFYDFDLSFDYQ